MYFVGNFISILLFYLVVLEVFLVAREKSSIQNTEGLRSMQSMVTKVHKWDGQESNDERNFFFTWQKRRYWTACY